VVPVLGTESNKKKFQLSVGYRESYANRLYNNTRPNHDLNKILRPKEWLNTIDVTGTYSPSDRFSLTASLPVVLNNISFLIPPGVDRRFGLPGRGIGDVTLLGRGFVLDPKKSPTMNLSLGLGVKLPTGSAGPQSTYPNVEGVFARRPATPNSIPPGDRGTGLIFEAIAFKTFTGDHLFKGSNVLFAANYLANARNTNNVASAISNLGLAGPSDVNALTNTVGDAYSLRATFSTPIPKTKSDLLKRVRLLASYRWEGIPKHDFIGNNRGFRQPGYVMAVGPGVNVRLYKQIRLTVEVPITVSGRIDANPHIAPGGPLRRFGFIAPVTVLARLTTTI
jgi:hypothetical protein